VPVSVLHTGHLVQPRLRGALLGRDGTKPQPRRPATLSDQDGHRHRVCHADPAGPQRNHQENRLPRRPGAHRSAGAPRHRRDRGPVLSYLSLWMFLAATCLLLTGYPVAFSLGGTAVLFPLIGSDMLAQIGLALPWEPLFHMAR